MSRRLFAPVVVAFVFAPPVLAQCDGAIGVTTLNSVSDPTWSPDGAEIAFGYDFDIWTVPAAGGPAVRLTTDTEFDFDPIWSPDGSSIAFERNLDIWVVDPVTGVETPLITGPDWQQWPTWSPNGDRIAFCVSDGSSSWDLWTRNLVTGDSSLVVDFPASDVLYPAWSPAGRYIAFEVREPGGEAGIGIVDLLTGDVSPLVDLPTHDGRPAWDPSGLTLAFETERDAVDPFDSDIWWMPVIAGTPGTATPVSCSDAFDTSPTWSPTGTDIAFLSQRGLLGGQFDLYVLDITPLDVEEEVSGAAQVITTVPIIHAAPNPFGAATTLRLELQGDESATTLRITDVRGRLVRELRVPAIGGAREVRWDGRDRFGREAPAGVYYVSGAGGVGRLVRTR